MSYFHTGNDQELDLKLETTLLGVVGLAVVHSHVIPAPQLLTGLSTSPQISVHDLAGSGSRQAMQNTIITNRMLSRLSQRS
jgi:hypothetical protein